MATTRRIAIEPIEVDVPDPLAYIGRKEEYEQAKITAIESKIPVGFVPAQSPLYIPVERRVEVRHVCVVNLLERVWNGIPTSERELWFGIATEGMEAPWMSPLGACHVKIWSIRRRLDGVVEYGIGNEVRPPDAELGWVIAEAFGREWPE